MPSGYIKKTLDKYTGGISQDSLSLQSSNAAYQALRRKRLLESETMKQKIERLNLQAQRTALWRKEKADNETFEERRERLDREAAKTRERRRKRAERELKEKMRLHLETEKCVSKSSSTQDINIDKDTEGNKLEKGKVKCVSKSPNDKKIKLANEAKPSTNRRTKSKADGDEIGVEVDSDDEYNPDDDTSQSDSISQVSDTSLPTKILSNSRTGRALSKNATNSKNATRSKNAKMVTNSNNDHSKVSVVADIYVSDKRKSVAAPQPHKKKKILPQSQLPNANVSNPKDVTPVFAVPASAPIVPVFHQAHTLNKNTTSSSRRPLMNTSPKTTHLLPPSPPFPGPNSNSHLESFDKVIRGKKVKKGKILKKKPAVSGITRDSIAVECESIEDDTFLSASLLQLASATIDCGALKSIGKRNKVSYEELNTFTITESNSEVTTDIKFNNNDIPPSRAPLKKRPTYIKCLSSVVSDSKLNQSYLSNDIDQSDINKTSKKQTSSESSDTSDTSSNSKEDDIGNIFVLTEALRKYIPQ